MESYVIITGNIVKELSKNAIYACVILVGHLRGIKIVEKRLLLFAVLEEGQVVVQGELLAAGRSRVELAHFKQLPTCNTALLLCNSLKCTGTLTL